MANTKKTHQQYENELFLKEINYWPIEQYAGSNKTILHECLNNHQWKATPSNILAGNGCKKCISLSYTKSNDTYIKEISIRNITIVDSYIDSKTPITHKCFQGHLWTATPNNILRGRGCPKCSKSSFDRNKPAILYFVQFNLGNIIYYKIGITNKTPKLRFGKEWNLYSMKLLWEIKFLEGEDARKLELLLLNKYKKNKINTELLKSGNSETFSTYIDKPF